MCVWILHCALMGNKTVICYLLAQSAINLIAKILTNYLVFKLHLSVSLV